MDSVGCRIAFRPPLDWDSLLTFLQARAAEGVESVESGRYARTAGIGKHAGWISVEPIPGAPALRIEMSTSLAPAFAGIVARVKRLFDLSANPLAIAEHLGGIADMNPGLRVPGAFDGFEVAVRAVLGQQVSVKGATTLARRFANVFGEAIETPIAGLARLTPTAARIASASVAELAAIGLPRTRASSIQALAAAIAGEHISLDRAAPAETTILRLRAIPGIGEWTAQYIAMRCLGWPDAFPHTDLGIKKALGTMDPSRAIEIAEKWRPWRAYATMHLWNSLSNSRNANFAEELGEESNR
jgi:AraC family transcriptional regulator of adaptative response / DNA-3-methyladenine glycosylase II